LTSVTPRVPATIAQNRPLEAIPTRPADIAVAPTADPYTQPLAASPAGGGSPFTTAMSASTPIGNAGSTMVVSDQPSSAGGVPLVASTRASGDPQAIQIGWHDIAGESIADQAKTVLAAIGVLAMILQALRWLSREDAKS
jgi:hypothetical protein